MSGGLIWDSFSCWEWFSSSVWWGCVAVDDQMMNDLCRALHDGYRKWMVEGGWAGHRYLPDTVVRHDREGVYDEVVCGVRGCILPAKRHDPWMLPFERLPDSRMRLYRTMVGNVVQTYARNGGSLR